MYDLMNNLTLIALMAGLFQNNLTKFYTQESFGRSGLVPYPKMSLFYTPRPV